MKEEGEAFAKAEAGEVRRRRREEKEKRKADDESPKARSRTEEPGSMLELPSLDKKKEEAEAFAKAKAGVLRRLIEERQKSKTQDDVERERPGTPEADHVQDLLDSMAL